MRDIIQSEMIIYEVIAKVSRARAKEYKEWLGPHTKHLLKEPGFLKAHIFEEIGEPLQNQEAQEVVLGVRYSLKDSESLDQYLAGPAQTLRQEALEKFGSSLSISRRVWRELSPSELSNRPHLMR